ncbi:MAG: hypothetical protein M0T77_15330 [Actinomycetota bacterium]|nr:hypothetical protein [Actinomycetota bacterium]
MSDQTSTTVALRAWAEGRYDLEATVELLSRAHDGRLARPQHPWVVADGQSAWIDPAAINGHNTGMLSGGERRLLAFTAALLEKRPVCLGDLALVDRATLELMLCALVHAGGSHGATSGAQALLGESQSFQLGQTASLHPWPQSRP